MIGGSQARCSGGTMGEVSSPKLLSVLTLIRCPSPSFSSGTEKTPASLQKVRVAGYPSTQRSPSGKINLSRRTVGIRETS